MVFGEKPGTDSLFWRKRAFAAHMHRINALANQLAAVSAANAEQQTRNGPVRNPTSVEAGVNKAAIAPPLVVDTENRLSKDPITFLIEKGRENPGCFMLKRSEKQKVWSPCAVLPRDGPGR